MEEPLELRVQGEVLAVTMRTPGRDEWLALGFLLSEGLIRSAADVGALAHCGRPGDEGFGNALEVTPAPGYRFPFDRLESSRRGTIASACGVCGRQRVDDLMARVVKVPAGAPVPLPVVQRGPEVLRHTQAIFEQTGGTHAAALLDVGGEVLVAAEDVGRHNAVDKVVGGALQKGLLSRAAVLMVSGRASFEMVQKAAMARVGVLASVSAPTTLAVDLAERAGLALVAFVRGSSAAIYGTRDRLALHAGQPREGG
ncbi:MAG: formate dehydrogenase accessory sulfurtransferase FdhD [Myxococcaceae bacterium]|nr:formate dehydrogenase accessory sulfurtransferase FdhD [Myxococcaceae bacterium]